MEAKWFLVKAAEWLFSIGLAIALVFVYVKAGLGGAVASAFAMFVSMWILSRIALQRR